MTTHRNHNESHRTKTSKTISNNKSTKMNYTMRLEKLLQPKCLNENKGYKFMKAIFQN